MTAATLPSPEPCPAADRCCNCGRLVGGLLRGRCRVCHEYKRKHGGQERPARLWNPRRPGPVWEPVEAGEAGPWCECGQAAWRLTVPLSERGKGALELCEGCAELERALSPVSSWSE